VHPQPRAPMGKRSSGSGCSCMPWLFSAFFLLYRTFQVQGALGDPGQVLFPVSKSMKAYACPPGGAPCWRLQ
jgi:hypothetical protein